MSIFRVVAGEHDLSQISGLEQNRDVSNFLIHPDYKKKTSENDIALIYVKNKSRVPLSNERPYFDLFLCLIM